MNKVSAVQSIDLKIMEQINAILGLGENKEDIQNYIEFVRFKSAGKITADIGNYNCIIHCTNNYVDVDKLVKVIYDTLKSNGVVNTQPYEFEGRFRPFIKIDEDLIIADIRKQDLSFRSFQYNLAEQMQKNRDKVFIFIIYDDLIDGEELELDRFTWYFKLEELSGEERTQYIITKLANNGIKFEKGCDYATELANEEDIDRAICDLIFRCKKHKIATINEKSLNRIGLGKVLEENEDAIQELDRMIGLDDVKKQLKRIINYIKVNKERRTMPMLNMCFLGNPGTGKSQCARYIAEIFKQEVILDGNFVEVTRADLVGGYIGQSALKTRAVLSRAKGGVLFIDECYSLFADSKRDYSNEVIAELVKSMEDNRNDLCVIFAGYTGATEEFLNSNQGLNSRIAFTIRFKDYSEQELYLIFKKMLEEKQYKIASNTKQVLLEHFKFAKKQKDFGNGRYCRNLLEKIEMEQASRVVEDDTADKDLIKLCDIKAVISNLEKDFKKERPVIGFKSA